MKTRRASSSNPRGRENQEQTDTEEGAAAPGAGDNAGEAPSEAALRESEERYRALVDNSLFGVLVIQEDKVLYINDVAVEMSGLPRERIKTVSDLLGMLRPRERARIEEFRSLLEGGEPVPTSYDTALVRPDGSELVLRVMSNRDLKLGGAPAVLLTVADVSDRARAEEALRASEARYRTLVESSRDAIVIADRDANVLFANSATLELAGIAPEEALGHNLYEFVHPDERSRTAALFLKEYKDGRGVSAYPMRVVVKGTERYFQATTALLGGEAEDPQVMVIISDISERVSAQKKLEESEERYRAIVEASHDAIITANRAGEILYANPAVKEILGVLPGDVVGRNIYRFIAREDRERAADELARVLRTGGTTPNYPVKLVREDGGHIHVEVNTGVVAWPSDDAFEIMMIRDVTDRQHRELERELHLKTEEGLAEMAKLFVQHSDPVEAINLSLALMGRLLSVKRAFYCALNEEGAAIEKIFEWTSVETRPLQRVLEGATEQWAPRLYASLKRGKEFTFSNVSEIEDDETRRAFEGIGTKSLALEPVVLGDTIRGFVGLSSHEAGRQWSVHEVNLLRQLAWTASRSFERMGWIEELDRSERFRTRITESIGEGLLVIADGTISWANSRAREIFGLSADVMTGAPFEVLQPDPDRLREIAGKALSAFSSGEDFVTEGKVARPDGSEIDVVATVTRLGSEKRSGELLMSVRDITESKRMREQVEAAAEAYSTLFSATGDGLVVHTLEGDILNANEQACAYTGYPVEELTRLTMQELAEPRVRELYHDRVDELRATGSTVFEVRLLRKDGSRMPVEATSRSTRIWGEDLVISSLRDITERKKAESETRRRAVQLVSLNEILVAATRSLDLGVLLSAVLDVAMEVTGASAGMLVLEDAPGSKALEVAKSSGLGPGFKSEAGGAMLAGFARKANTIQGAATVKLGELTAREQDLLRGALEEGETEDLLLVALRSGQKFLGFLGLLAEEGVFREEDRAFYSTVGAETGVCIENSLIYHELTAEHERLTLLYRSAQNISTQLELGTLLQTTLEEAARAAGAESAIIGLIEPGVGDYVWAGAHGLDISVLEEVRLPITEGVGGHVVKAKRAVRWSSELFASDPVIAAMGIGTGIAFPLIAGDMVVGVLSVQNPGRELSVGEEDVRLLEAMGRQAGVAIENARLYEETRRHLAALEKANLELMTLDRMKSDFVSTVSHELRSPLAVIEGFAKTLVEHFDRIDRNTERESIEIILKKSVALEGLIENILDMSRIEEGRLEVMPRSFDIVELCDKVRGDQEIVADSQRVVVADGGAEIFVFADPDKTEVVLSNLVGNAIKFSPDGGTVTITPKKSDGEVSVSVADTGIGIPVDEQGKIFERFYQVDRGETRSFQGSGLGLYITRELVQTMGGRLSVVSAPGEGSTFTFTIPFAL